MYFEILIQQYATTTMPVETPNGLVERESKLGTTWRKIFSDYKDAMKVVNIYNRKANTISISVNPYLELTEDGRPNYRTVYVKRTYFDLDEANVGYARKLSDYLLEEDVMHQIRFSGKGFHILPFVCNLTNNINEGMMALQETLKHKLNITFCSDEDSGYCRKDKMVRIPNTFNKKRNRYCIPLSREDLDMEYEEIRDMARSQRFKNIIEGEKMWDLSQFNNCRGFVKKRNDLSKHLNNIIPIHITEALESIGLDFQDLCPAVRYLLNKRTLNYKERYLLIVYLKDICGFKLHETVNIMKDSIIDDRFYHSHYFENQPYYIYVNGYHHNCDKMKRFGLCDPDCTGEWLDV